MEAWKREALEKSARKVLSTTPEPEKRQRIYATMMGPSSDPEIAELFTKLKAEFEGKGATR